MNNKSIVLAVAEPLPCNSQRSNWIFSSKKAIPMTNLVVLPWMIGAGSVMDKWVVFGGKWRSLSVKAVVGV